MKFRKKPVVIEAVQLTKDTFPEVMAFTKELGESRLVTSLDPPEFVIRTLEGDMTATDGDWIIRGVAGEFYPCKPGIFSSTYEPVQE